MKDVSNNCIETLPTSMGELTSLRRLDFHCNKIGIIPQGELFFIYLCCGYYQLLCEFQRSVGYR